MPPEAAPLPGFGRRELDSTAAAILEAQDPLGWICWEPGRHADPWNHVEAAMALDVAGQAAAAERAYTCLVSAQRADGSWAAAYRDGRETDLTADANFTAYVATGAWHHYLAGLDEGFLRELWPTIEAAIRFTLALQAPGGEVWWARDPAGRPWPGALVTSSACIHLSLRCALAIADVLGCERPAWELARRRLAHALARGESSFEPKPRFAMDWYYPVLAGAVQDAEADRRLSSRWDEFVVAGQGVRCVHDRPWVTVAETCELVIALDAVGHSDRARELFAGVQALRTASGRYWTGVVYPELAPWPEEQPTWTAAAVVLAADALAGRGRTAGLFRDDRAELEAAEARLEAAG